MWFVLFIGTGFFGNATEMDWETVKQSKEGEISVHYRINEPFLIKSNDGTLRGLEYEMMIGFKYYLLNKYDIKLDLKWNERGSFRDIFNFVKDEARSGDFGLDIVSRTAEREKFVQFSDPYFPDIQVLISKRTNSVVSSIEEFKEQFESFTAISVQETTYDLNLQQIKTEHDMDFNIKYINSSNDIIKTILQSDQYFGYTDLPNYLIALNNNEPVIRHNIFPVKGIGLCIIFNKESDWSEPFNEYLSSAEFALLQSKGVKKYLGTDVNNLIKSISSGQNEEIMLLKQEKKFINQELSEKARQVETQSMIRNILIVSIILALTIAYFLFNRNRIKTTANEVLTLHRKMIESQNKLLSARNDELVELNEEKNNFIQILSHDLRAPINNINGLSKILLMDGQEKLDADQLRMINHISAESRRLNKMVTRILDIERIESKSTEEFRPIDTHKVLDRVVGNYIAQAKDKNIIVDTHFAEGVFVMGLEQFLFHVFENLLSNAIKFSPMGETVYIRSAVNNGELEVSFVDNGPGMSEEDKKNMFKKFQVLTAKATAGERSTGLGLSIVQKYVNLLNGTLDCQSVLDKGTTFIVRLKTVAQDADSKPTS